MQFVWGILLLTLLIPIVWIDFKRQIIPDGFSMALAVVGLTFHIVNYPQQVGTIVIETIAVLLVFTLIRALYYYIRKQQGLGFGDVKLLAAATLWVGAVAIPQLMLIATTSGLFYVIALYHFRYGPNKVTKIAFGPHICLGLIVTWWTNEFLLSQVS